MRIKQPEVKLQGGVVLDMHKLTKGDMDIKKNCKLHTEFFDTNYSNKEVNIFNTIYTSHTYSTSFFLQKELEAILERMESRKPFKIVIQGIAGSGKTTLLRRLIEGSKQYDFYEVRDPSDILREKKSNKDCLIIDNIDSKFDSSEIQRMLLHPQIENMICTSRKSPV